MTEHRTKAELVRFVAQLIEINAAHRSRISELEGDVQLLRMHAIAQHQREFNMRATNLVAAEVMS